jgi:lysophospholipase L1-like esterase
MDSEPSRHTASWAKLIAVNLLIFFVIFNLLYWSIPLVSTTLRVVAHETEIRAPLPPNYNGIPWARRHYEERAMRGTVYRSFVEWRHAPLAGETITVEGPYLQRRTINENTSRNTMAYFFGGSTMWGDGANDAGTIPSQFANLTGIFSENFAERGYTAHQSLIQLMHLLQQGHRPALVIFYDGVNEVLHKCRAELTADSHERERQFEMVLQSSLDADSFSHYAAPLFKFARNMRREFQRAINTDQYDCHKNPAKRQAIADNLIRDWEFAKDLAERHGAKFVAILQPVSPLSNTRLEHVGIPPLVERGYKEIYPLIRDKIAQSGQFQDFVPVLDRDEHIYIDFCHLSPNGNRHVAQKIAEVVAPLGFMR